jgi:hypothetical protein
MQVASKKQAACCLHHAACLLGLLSNPEGGGNMFHQNVGELVSDYMASHVGY